MRLHFSWHYGALLFLAWMHSAFIQLLMCYGCTGVACLFYWITSCGFLSLQLGFHAVTDSPYMQWNCMFVVFVYFMYGRIEAGHFDVPSFHEVTDSLFTSYSWCSVKANLDALRFHAIAFSIILVFC